MKNTRKIFYILGLLIIGTAFVALVTKGALSVWHNFSTGFGAVQLCHSLEVDVTPAVAALTVDSTVEGKLYGCGQRRGDLAQEFNEIVYTIRGREDPTLTTVQLREQLSQELIRTDWVQIKPKTTAGEAVFRRMVAPDRTVEARLEIISPKYRLFNLEFSTVSGKYKTHGDDDTRLENKIPDVDLHAQYASFAKVEPTHSPDGYGEWSYAQPRAWRANADPEPHGFVTSSPNRYTLSAGTAGDDGYELQQRLYESDNVETTTKLARLLPLGTTAEGLEVYGELDFASQKEVRAFVLKRNDSLVELRWDAGADASRSNFIDAQTAFHIFESLRIKG